MTEPGSDSLFAGIPADLPEELETLLASGRRFSLKRIVSRGHQSPGNAWYDQEDCEWVVLLSGAARLVFEDDPEPINMGPGDWVLIPAHSKHRVDWTDPSTDSVWLALYFEPEGG